MSDVPSEIDRIIAEYRPAAPTPIQPAIEQLIAASLAYADGIITTIGRPTGEQVNTQLPLRAGFLAAVHAYRQATNQ